MAKGVAGGFVVSAEEVYVENIFPGTSAHGARLDLTEADVAQGENAERLEERSGQVLYLEGDGGLVGTGRNEALVAGGGASASLFVDGGYCRFPCRFTNQEEAGEVAFVIFDAGPENFAGVLARGVASGDAGGVGKAVSDDVFHAACGVVERDRLNLGMVAEEVAALVERHRMREHLAQRAELHAWGSDHIVHDAQPEFALNEDVSCDEQISMLSDRAGQRVLDGDYGGGDRSALQPVEHFGGARAGHNCAAPQHAFRSFVAEGAEFALDRNFDGGGFHYMARYLETGAKRKLIPQFQRLNARLCVRRLRYA